MQTDLQKAQRLAGGGVGVPPLDGVVPRSWLEGGMALLDAQGVVTDANEPMCGWLERQRGEVVGKDFWEVLAAFSSDWKSTLAEMASGKQPFERRSLKFAAPDSPAAQWFILELGRSPAGIFVRLNSTLPPLSELEEAIWDEHLRGESARREMFMRLLRAEAQLDGLMRRWPSVIFSQRPDFSMQFVSPNIADLTGIPAADWATQPKRFWELVHELDAPELQKQFKRAVQTGADITNTFRIRHATTGRVAYILEHRQPTISHNRLLLGYEVVWLDVTRQTIAEKRLSTAAWKETLAVLTLGMAHDFRNIMAGIHSLSESYLDQVEAHHPFKEGLSLIKNSSMQASQLVQRMINLHLGQTGEKNYHNLNEIVTDLVELVSKILRRRIRVVTELMPESLPVYVDVVEFRQVVINLLLNAADAMAQGGDLTLRTSRHETFPDVNNMKGMAPRLPCICLTIQDTGCGIKQRHLSSIFDPFFTTKSKGSGLGLYNARIAVEKYRGAISVESQEGAGASFQLWLPQADFNESSQEEVDVNKQRVTRKCLLLFGQEGEMLLKTAELLRSHNYQIVVANSSENIGELLQSPDYQFAGIMLLAEPNDTGVTSLVADARQQKKDLKVAMKLVGCNQDDLDSQLFTRVDLLLNSELSEADMLARLKSFF